MKNNKLLFLDLDNCLIYSSYQEIDSLTLIDKKKWHYLYHRPFLKEFLKFVSKSFDLIFYTSSKLDYAKWVVKSFNLNTNYKIYSRQNTKKRVTNYGEYYNKSLSYIDISQHNYKKISVLDDRTDLWLDEHLDYWDIRPWMGEADDNELELLIIKRLKKQARSKEFRNSNNLNEN